MQIILLSGGSGTRLWPLSNDARSKQFLRLLPSSWGDQRESMIQRVVRQLKETKIDADLTVATSASQRDSVISQLGNEVEIVTEPCRRDTFPAICLACEYLALVKNASDDEAVVVMPCDSFAQPEYFTAIKEMGNAVATSESDLVVMGIHPTYPSAKYGYILPEHNPSDSQQNCVTPVKQFTEKPSVNYAEKLIEQGAFWNGGVFAFRLGYLRIIVRKYLNETESFEEIVAQYERLPKISFDYEVAEKAKNVGMITYSGFWKDLGTWNTLSDELPSHVFGNVITDETCENTHLFNELGIPMLCLGTKDLVVAASPDGILISEKSKSENIRSYTDKLKRRPMYEERRWGTYKVIDTATYTDNSSSLTKHLTLNPGSAISYQRHNHRDEIWTFVDGEGIVVVDGIQHTVGRGDVVSIKRGQLHALKANTSLSFIEVQLGTKLIEEDIERFDYEW